MQNIARYAGVHLYADGGDMVWSNKSFLAIYSQSTGFKTISIPSPKDIFDAYLGDQLATDVSSFVLEMDRWETRFLFLRDSSRLVEKQ